MEISEKIQMIEEWISNEKEYKNRAMLVAVKHLLVEQSKRIEQAQLELDGRMWSPSGWNQ